MATIAFFEAEDQDKQKIKKVFSGHKLLISSKTIHDENLSSFSDAEIISVFVYSKVSQQIISSFPKLKLIATRSTGYDHIDIYECNKRSISISTVPNYGKHTVAEHAFALLLALARKMEQSIERTRRAVFESSGLTGFDLNGKTIGVIGTGNIGLHAIQIARGFGMNVIAYDAFPNEGAAKLYGYRYVSLIDLLKNSDIITIHVPLIGNTTHMLNKKNMKLIKKGAVLINTSRGGIVETAALVDALNSGRLVGVGLDVLEEELLIKDKSQLFKKLKRKQLDTALSDYYLLDHPSVIVTPHNAFNTKEALGRILDQTIENIQSFLKNKPINIVK